MISGGEIWGKGELRFHVSSLGFRVGERLKAGASQVITPSGYPVSNRESGDKAWSMVVG